MVILGSCCYWKSVRVGSFASASYTLVYFIFSTIILGLFIRDEWPYISGAGNHPYGESFLDAGDITPITVIFNIIFLCDSILLVLASIVLLIGLYYNMRFMLLPWILLMMFDILIECAHLITLVINQRVVFNPIVGVLFTLDFFIMCLNLYCLLCVVSQYQVYRQALRQSANSKMPTLLYLAEEEGDEKESPRDPVEEQSVELTAQTNIPTFTRFLPPQNMSVIAEE